MLVLDGGEVRLKRSDTPAVLRIKPPATSSGEVATRPSSVERDGNGSSCHPVVPLYSRVSGGGLTSRCRFVDTGGPIACGRANG